MSSSPTETESLVDVVLPAIGTSIAEGTIIGWSKNVGDDVVADETLCEVTTDKVDTECPSPVAGVLQQILAEVGETVEVGSVIARIAVAGGGSAPAAAPPSPVAAAAAPVTMAAAAVPKLPDAKANGNGHGGDNRRRYSPVVMRMAEKHDLDLTQIDGTGAGHRVTKRDVLAFIERQAQERPLHSESPYRPDPVPASPAAAPSASVEQAPSRSMAVATEDLGGTSEQLSRMRRSIGAAMRRSQETAATCHTVVECDMTRVEARRRELGLTALPLVARATVETLREFPELNATLDGETITRYERVHLGMAVSLGADGLIVPVIRDAQDLAPQGLGRAIGDLARSARARQLSPDQVRGATFTITSPGAAGALLATPIINVPQVAILDLEAIVRRPVVVTDADRNESIAIRSMANLVLGWDHRALDGIYAAQFLTALRRRVEAI